MAVVLARVSVWGQELWRFVPFPGGVAVSLLGPGGVEVILLIQVSPEEYKLQTENLAGKGD